MFYQTEDFNCQREKEKYAQKASGLGQRLQIPPIHLSRSIEVVLSGRLYVYAPKPCVGSGGVEGTREKQQQGGCTCHFLSAKH